MSKANNIDSHYYSGQGVVMLAQYDDQNKLTGYIPVGNVSALTIGIETARNEHRESQTGARGVDRVVTTEVGATVSMTVENFIQENLALGLYGSSAAVEAAAGQSMKFNVMQGRVYALDHIAVENVVVDDGQDPVVMTYEEDKNYTVNTDAGSIRIMTEAEQTEAGAANVIADNTEIGVTYDFGDHKVLQGLETSSAPVRALRFEGLNTVEDDATVVVEVFRFETAPLAEYALINEEIANIELSGSALADATITEGSRYFRQLSVK
ncbi:major tail protein [Vibrio phage vB_ValS_VA-RY-4]|nr:major tail protein [Vibrio phage vB_VpaS_VP-RY-9]UFD98252.1 major tail protein [Vibrio phage vB_ValS_VA-RY-4]